MFLSGTADAGTLDQASHLVGDEESTRAVGHPGPRWTLHDLGAGPQRRLLAPDALRRLPAGTGVLVYGALPPVHVALRPWWADPGTGIPGGHPQRAPATPGLPGPADP